MTDGNGGGEGVVESGLADSLAGPVASVVEILGVVSAGKPHIVWEQHCPRYVLVAMHRISPQQRSNVVQFSLRSCYFNAEVKSLR